jgi:hypothetical protein
MKKIVISAIVLISVFSWSALVNAENKWFIADTLNLDVWVEIFELNNINLQSHTFRTKNLQKTYNNMVNINKLFKNLAVQNYEEWKLTDYELNGLINNYSKFIYYANQMFSDIEILDLWLDDSQELLDSINKNYTFVRSYYLKIEAILNNSEEEKRS